MYFYTNPLGLKIRFKLFPAEILTPTQPMGKNIHMKQIDFDKYSLGSCTFMVSLKLPSFAILIIFDSFSPLITKTESSIFSRVPLNNAYFLECVNSQELIRTVSRVRIPNFFTKKFYSNIMTICTEKLMNLFCIIN